MSSAITFITNLSLARKLLEKKRYCRGYNKIPELPPEMVSTKERKPFTTIFGFQQDCMIVSYCPKKNKLSIF
jgi:hypothetical protein